MRAPLLLATDKKPGLQTYLGPRGPSGVMKMSEVCWRVSTIEIIACAPLLLLDPLTVPMPRNLKNAQSQAPSRLALTRPDIGKFGLKIYLHMGRKKILLCHARPIRRFLYDYVFFGAEMSNIKFFRNNRSLQRAKFGKFCRLARYFKICSLDKRL